VVDLPRSHDQPVFQAQTAEWFLSQNHEAQPAPTRIVSPLGRATTALFRLPSVYRAAAIGHGERPAAGRRARFAWCHWHPINDLPSGRTSAALRSECRSSRLRQSPRSTQMVRNTIRLRGPATDLVSAAQVPGHLSEGMPSSAVNRRKLPFSADIHSHECLQ
jgi:hypothetical protein